jgi:hypothetical protein
MQHECRGHKCCAGLVVAVCAAAAAAAAAAVVVATEGKPSPQHLRRAIVNPQWRLCLVSCGDVVSAEALRTRQDVRE